MNFLFFIFSAIASGIASVKLYNYYLIKRNSRAASKGGAIAGGIFVFILSFIIFRSVFDTVWTSVIFIILCVFLLPGILDPQLLSKQNLKNNIKPLSRKQLISFFGVATFILMIIGSEKSTESPNTLATTPVETTKIDNSPVMLQSVAPEQTTSIENTDSSLPDEDVSLEPTVATGEEIAEDDDSATIFEDSDDEDCSGLPTRCSDMRDCAQAEQALACGNSRLDRDDDGVIPPKNS